VVLGLGFYCKRAREFVQGAGKPVQGSCGAVGCCRAATAELRRRGVGEWRPDNGVAYGLKGLAQKEARGSRVLTECLRWTDCGMLAVAVDGSKQRFSAPLDSTGRSVYVL